MALTLMRPFQVAFAVVLATFVTCAPSRAQSNDPIETLERSSIALVYIDNTEFGVGFVVASNASSSYLLTAAHVLGCADTDAVGCRDTVKVRFVGELSSITGTKVLAKKDIKDGTDLALVKIDRGNLTPVAVLSRTITDDEFYVIGFSQRIIESSDSFGGRPEVHDGNVSRINSPELQNFIEVSVPAYPGFSGGPIVDKATHAVVGVFTGHLRPEDQTQIDYQGVGPARILKFLADAEALTHAPFTQISMETKSEAAAAAPSDPISVIASAEYSRPAAAATAVPESAVAPLPGAAPATPTPARQGVAAPAGALPRPVSSSLPATPLTQASDFGTKLAAARAGDPAGEFLAALAYQSGIGVEPDQAAGIHWLQQAAVANYPPALTSLALAYQNGTGIGQDDVQALSLYQRAAGLGDILAAFNLGRTYHYGKLGTTPDEALSAKWYGKGLSAATAASGRGDATATWTLANAYLNGVGVGTDTTKGVALLSLASEQGSAGATNNLALAYMRGRLVPRDTAKGIALFTKSAKLGGPKSALDLAAIYFNGSYGVPADPNVGLRYLEQAATLGDAQAMWRLGLDALNGVYMPVDLNAAGAWFRKATALMYLPGETQYGRWLVETGPPAARDPKRGLAYMEDAADKGWSGAEWYLGTFYHEGRIVPQDENKAFSYFQKAALDGNPSAQYDLGRAYERGLGVAADPNLARFWYQLSANQGDAAAKRKLEVATK